MRARVVSDDAYRLTRAMNQLGRQARPVFREAGTRVADVAARDLRDAAGDFSRQSRGVAGSIKARRDRVPYVSANRSTVFAKRGASKRTSVRVGHVAAGSEYGSRSGRFVAPRHGATAQPWRPAGYWWHPTVKARRDAWTRIWLKALGDLIDQAERVM